MSILVGEDQWCVGQLSVRLMELNIYDPIFGYGATNEMIINITNTFCQIYYLNMDFAVD